MTAASDSRLRTFVRAANAPEPDAEDLSPLLNASVVVARQHMAAKKLRAEHADVIAAMSKAYRLDASRDAKDALCKSLERFFETASTALGLDAPKVPREPEQDVEERYSPIPEPPRSR